MSRKSVRTFSIVLALICTVLVAVAPYATADNWAGASGVGGDCHNLTVNRTDSAAMSFHYEDLEPQIATALDWVRSVKIDPSDLSTSTHATPTSATDVIVRDRFYDDYCGYPWPSIAGATFCASLRPDNSCEQSHVRIRNGSNATGTVATTRVLICHEVGHSIGLRHRDVAGCMHTTSFASASYNTHDLTHINNAF